MWRIRRLVHFPMEQEIRNSSSEEWIVNANLEQHKLPVATCALDMSLENTPHCRTI